MPSNPYSVPSMIGKWLMLSVRLGVRCLARLGPIAEEWDRVLTPPEHLNKHQLQRREIQDRKQITSDNQHNHLNQ